MNNIGKLLAAAGVAMAGGAGLALTQRVSSGAQKVVGTSLDSAVRGLREQWVAGAGGNYVSATKSVRVEPYVLIDESIASQPYARDILLAAQRTWTAYYVLSIAAENKIGKVSVAKRLDKFAPDRDLTAATKSFLSTESNASLLSSEAYLFGLPFVGEAAGFNRYQPEYSPESNEQGKPSDRAGFATGLSKIVSDVNNLSVGQIVDIKIVDDGKEGTVPVMIRLRPIGMSPSTMATTLSVGSESNDQAWRKWRVGEYTLLADIVAGRSKVREYRAAAMNDSSGYFRKVHERANRGLIAHFLTGQPSIGAATSIAVMSRDTAREIEDKVGGRLDDFEVRQRIFDHSLLMLVYVVDTDRETVTVYTQDIDDYAVYSLGEFKSQGARSGTEDITDLMKALMIGKLPGRL